MTAGMGTSHKRCFGQDAGTQFQGLKDPELRNPGTAHTLLPHMPATREEAGAPTLAQQIFRLFLT